MAQARALQRLRANLEEVGQCQLTTSWLSSSPTPSTTRPAGATPRPHRRPPRPGRGGTHGARHAQPRRHTAARISPWLRGGRGRRADGRLRRRRALDRGSDEVAGDVEFAGPMAGPDGAPVPADLRSSPPGSAGSSSSTPTCCRSCRPASSTRCGSSDQATARPRRTASRRARSTPIPPGAPTSGSPPPSTPTLFPVVEVTAEPGDGDPAADRSGRAARCRRRVRDYGRRLWTRPPSASCTPRRRPSSSPRANEVVKALRKEKRRDEATALAALRRPGWDDWALNVVAAEQPRTVTAFTGAAADVRDAQAAAIEGRDGPDIRDALKSLRDRSAELVGLATDALGRAGRQPGPGELNARLAEVAASDTAAAQLRAAILGSGDASPQDLFGELEPAPRPAPARKPAQRRRRQAWSQGRSEGRGPSAPPSGGRRGGDREARGGDRGVGACRGGRGGCRGGAPPRRAGAHRGHTGA